MEKEIIKEKMQEILTEEVENWPTGHLDQLMGAAKALTHEQKTALKYEYLQSIRVLIESMIQLGLDKNPSVFVNKAVGFSGGMLYILGILDAVSQDDINKFIQDLVGELNFIIGDIGEVLM